MEELERKRSKVSDLLEVECDSIVQDWISLLPDEVIVYILSFLPLRQVVGTSLLSRRWRNIWMKLPNLTFNAYNMFSRELNYVEQRLRTLQFVRSVDRVLRRLMSPSLTFVSFSGHYELSGAVVSHIDRWVLFALDHNVQNLNLHFFKGSQVNSWFFPPRVGSHQTTPCSLSQLRLGGCEVAPSFGGFKNLRLVSLTYVVFTDQAFENVMSNCLFLEDLFVCSAKKLTRIKIPELLVRLKFLHIFFCHDLLKLEVNATNLESFTYIGPKISVSFNNVAKLKMLRLCGIDETSSQLMTKNLMLSTLILDFDLFFDNIYSDSRLLPTLTNLRVLILSVVSLSNGFLGFINFLRAAPSLHKYELHLKGPDFYIHDLDVDLNEKFCHENLREIELSGFLAEEWHIELALLLIETAVALEKITIVPYCKRLYLNKWQCEPPEQKQLDAIQNCADQISSKLPPTAKLEILKY